MHPATKIILASIAIFGFGAGMIVATLMRV